MFAVWVNLPRTLNSPPSRIDEWILPAIILLGYTILFTVRWGKKTN